MYYCRRAWVPCSFEHKSRHKQCGAFPTLITLAAIFFSGSGAFSSAASVAVLTGLVLCGALVTLAISKLLSVTLLKGIPSSFTLELPPYRRPKIGRVIVRSIFDRTLFVLGRAVKIAAPAGLIIWLLANTSIGGQTPLSILTDVFNPFAVLIGLDGVILLAFLLGLPANEIVLPVAIMCYMSGGSLTEIESLSELKELFGSNGWKQTTALCTMLFSLMHWPCSTTLLTIKKETGSWGWTLLSAALPTVCGIVFCFIISSLGRLL